ncbi:tetratricopeptide repeat protein [Planctomycetota bacterium]
MYIRSLVVFLIVLVSSGINLSAEESWSETKLIRRFEDASIPDSEINLAEGALAIAKSVYSHIDINEYLATIDQLAKDIRVKLPAGSPPEKIIQAINRYLYETKGVQAVSMDTDMEEYQSFLLSKVVDSMKGNCLGLSTLYWTIAERLELPLQAIIIPRHVFLRHDQRNIEATSNGRELSQEDYLEKTEKLKESDIPKYSIGQEVRFMSLNKKQFMGLIIYNRGVNYNKDGETELALHDFTKALKMNPENIEAYKSRAGIYLKKDAFTQALDDFTKALALEPDCPSTLYGIGTTYFKMERLKEAFDYMNKTIDLAPDYAEAYHNRGVIYSTRKDYRKALTDFSQTIALKADYAPAYFNRGLVWFNLAEQEDEPGFLSKSLDDYSRAITLDSGYVEAYNNRGITYCKQREFEYAVNDFLDVINRSPDYPDAYRNLGIAYFELARYDKAISYLKEYLTKRANHTQEIERFIKEAHRRLDK